MTRVNAALLAGVVTALLFVAADGVASWVVRSSAFWNLAGARHYLPVLTAINCLMWASFTIVLVRRRKKAKDQDVPLTPQPASERLKTPRAF